MYNAQYVSQLSRILSVLLGLSFRLKEPEVHDLTESAVEKYREGIMTGTVFSEEVQQAITVGFFSNEKSPIYQVITSSSLNLLPFFPTDFFYCFCKNHTLKRKLFFQLKNS